MLRMVNRFQAALADLAVKKKVAPVDVSALEDIQLSDDTADEVGQISISPNAPAKVTS